MSIWQKALPVMSAEHNITDRRSIEHSFLVASPYAHDTPYARSVVFVLGFSPQGAVGVRLDRELLDALKQLQSGLRRSSSLRMGQTPRPVAFPVRICVWGPGTLDLELRRGIWLSSAAGFEEIFSEHGDLWVDLVRQIGHSVLRDSLQIPSLPADPSVN
jgi:putative AlgH/UPF0301 family transcriptional regulator